jgi:hypothetical protein
VPRRPQTRASEVWRCGTRTWAAPWQEEGPEGSNTVGEPTRGEWLALAEVVVVEDIEWELHPDAGLGPDIRALALPFMYLGPIYEDNS